jgi:segregation and condensation protein B
MDQALITRIVEAALLAANQPLTLAQLHGLFPEEQPALPGSVEQALEQLRDACAERGVELVEVASGFRYQVKEEVHGWISRMWTERKTKYTRATLETLALIAYRQPITRGEIEAVRGVAVSSNTIQALEERDWIRVVGHRDVPGKPALFGTTKIFLDYFGLKRLDELPPLSELKDIGDLEPQLFTDGAPVPVGLPGPDAVPEDAITGAGDESQAANDETQEVADAAEAAEDLERVDLDRTSLEEEEQDFETQPSEQHASQEPLNQEQDETEGPEPESQVSSEQKQ